MDEYLRSLIRAAVPHAAVDWGWSAQGASLPRIVLYRVSGGPDYTMSGPSGLAEARVQVDCFAGTMRDAKMIGRAVRSALSGLRSGVISGAFLDQERDLPPDTDGAGMVARVSLDFNIHYQEG